MVPTHRYCTACGAANQAKDAFCFACGRPLRASLPSPQYPVGGSATSTSTGLLPPNLLLKQRYRIISQIGKGGFGAVYKAEDTQLGNRLLAVKEMSQSGLSPQEIVEATGAFKREAHMLAGLKHPNLPSIYDYFNEAGRWYLVMDFIEGETLEEHLNKEKEGSLPCEEVLQIGIQLCTVLGYLHNRQPPIIFRDLKPANVMLTTEGHLYLIDFGIARHFKPGQMRDTIAFGSPGYAAPEQYGKTQTTSRADIYSLGATLHQMLTGDNPSDTPFHFATLQLRGQPTPPGLETLIMQMVDLDESKRPDGMDIIKQKLQSIAITQTAKQINFPQPGVPVQSVQPSDPLPLAQTSTSGVSQKSEKQYWLDRGNDLYKAKRFLDAVYACEQAQRHDPDDASIYNLKGDVLIDLKRYQEALTAFERAIQLDPNSATAYKNKGHTLIYLKRYEEALATLEQALQLDPNLATVYRGKGITLIHLKRYEEALAAYEHSLQLDPNNAVALANKGSIFFTFKRYGEALATLEQALQLDPSNVEIYNNKVITLYELKRYEEALAVCEQALQLDPNLAITYSNKGNILVMLKHYDAALASFEQALQLDPDLVTATIVRAKILDVKAKILDTFKRLEEADVVTQRNHKLALVYSAKGRDFSNRKRFREALNAYETAIRLNPQDAAVYNLKGETLNNLKRYEEALTTFERAIQLDPSLAIAYSNKGFMLYTLRRHGEALAACEQAIQLDPNNSSYYADKGLALYHLKRYEEALIACDQAIQLDPNLAIAYFHKGSVLELLGRSNEARLAHDRAKLLGYKR